MLFLYLIGLCCSVFGGYVHNENIYLNYEQSHVLEKHEDNKPKYIYTMSGYTLIDLSLFTDSSFLLGYAPLVFDSNHNNKTCWELIGQSQYVRMINWRNVNSYSSDLGFSNGVEVTQCKYTYNSTGYGSSTKYNTYTFNIASSIFSITYSFDALSFDTTSNTSGFGTCVFDTTYNGSTCLLIVDNNYSAIMDYIFNADNNPIYEGGYNTGYREGITEGQQIGFENGYDTALENSSTAVTIFTGILEVALIPINIFLTIFEFEVFGINIAGFVSGLLTIGMIMILIRFIFGGKQDDK